MPIFKRILFFFVLPILAFLSYPPDMIGSNVGIGTIILIGLVVAFFILLGFILMSGRTWALTLAIFLQGLNVIIRLMMLLPNSYSLATQNYDFPYIVMSLIGLALSFYLMLRIDRIDVRLLMVT